MARWQPNAPSRLAAAAMELYAERGFDQTTVAEIADRAGLTERTFFRHYADKREVLFAGQDGLREAMVEAVRSAPPDSTALDAVHAAVRLAGDLIGPDPAYSLARWKVISANSGLRERELIKLAGLAQSLAQALRDRGVVEPAASLAAETGIACFRIGYEAWIADPGAQPLSGALTTAFAGLAALGEPALSAGGQRRRSV